MLKTGDKVRIVGARNIEGNIGYFENGDETEIVEYKGCLALKHEAKELQGGLVFYPEEQQFLVKL